MSLFCTHDWQSRTGMDSGSYCVKCGAISHKEIDINRSGGLQNGTLKNNHTNDCSFISHVSYSAFLTIGKTIDQSNSSKKEKLYNLLKI